MGKAARDPGTVSRRMLKRILRPWPDSRAEATLGAASLLLGACLVAMVVFVAVQAWPMFQHEGLAWLGSGGNVDTQLGNMVSTGAHPPASAYHLRAWPLIYGTLLTTGMALVLALPTALLSSIFIVEFAPSFLRRITIPVIRLLASVPSVIYGLIGILVLVPFVGNDLITSSEKTSVQNVVQLTGAGLGVAAIVLAVMITPIMVALITDALTTVPRSWREGAVALGLNPLRATLAVSMRAIRPAIVAAAVLATARALGEAVMLYMVSGSVGFAPKPIDGVIFFFEPLKTLAAAIVESAEGLGAPALHAAAYAFALLLLFSAFTLSLAGYLVKLPLRKYEVRA
jgi:phosphate transport system permease protein